MPGIYWPPLLPVPIKLPTALGVACAALIPKFAAPDASPIPTFPAVVAP